MNKIYTGIGSRQTPTSVLAVFAKVANRLERRGYLLRSGAATGADTAFELGVVSTARKQIFLPWERFNNSTSGLHFISAEAFMMAEQFHPNWKRCGDAARKFHARNCYQVLGLKLNKPCDFIVCWTPGGKQAGGTGQALRIAQEYKIPVINFGSEDLLTSPMDQLRNLVVGDGT